jgi:hypothetical protein
VPSWTELIYFKGWHSWRCFEISPPLLWFIWVRKEGNELQEKPSLGLGARRGGKQILWNWARSPPLCCPCWHLINASCGNVYPGGHLSCLPSYHKGGKRGCLFPSIQATVLNTAAPPRDLGSCETEVSDIEEVVTGCSYVARRSCLYSTLMPVCYFYPLAFPHTHSQFLYN